MSASLKFQDCTTTQRDCFLDCLAGADAARQEAVTTATAEKHALSRGDAGLSSCSSSGPGTTSSSTRCHPETEQSFSAPLPTGQLFGAKVFATGCVDSPRHRLMCMLVLPAQPAQGPRERRHRPAFIPSTAAAPRMQPVRPGRAAGEGDHLPAPPRDRLRQGNGRGPCSRATSRRRLLLRDEVLRMLQSQR